MKVSDTSKFLEAMTLEEGQEVTVTIEGVRSPGKDDKGLDGRVIGSDHMILKYKGKQKEHVIGRLVQKQIRRHHGNDTDNWIGKDITIFRTTCNAFGDPETPCLRVKGKRL